MNCNYLVPLAYGYCLLVALLLSNLSIYPCFSYHFHFLLTLLKLRFYLYLVLGFLDENLTPFLNFFFVFFLQGLLEEYRCLVV